jgi:hypothetical protein
LSLKSFARTGPKARATAATTVSDLSRSNFIREHWTQELS